MKTRSTAGNTGPAGATPRHSPAIESTAGRRMGTERDRYTGNFGLSGTRLVVDPKTEPDQLAMDALCLVGNALGVFEQIADSVDVVEAHFGGLYLLRQALIVMHAQSAQESKSTTVAVQSEGGAA